MRKNAKNNKKGFTLIELIVVVAILVALMLMLVPKLTGFTEDAKRTANEANARAIYTAIVASETAESTGLYPKADRNITICQEDGSATKSDVKAYEKFWGESDANTAIIVGNCKYDGTKVTYTSGGVDGVYPKPDTNTTTE